MSADQHGPGTSQGPESPSQTKHTLHTKLNPKIPHPLHQHAPLLLLTVPPTPRSDLPRAGAQLPVDCVLLLGWVAGALLRGCDACRAVGGGLQSGAALIGIRLDVGSLPPRSSSLTVTGCRLGGFPVRRDRWGGERVVGGVLPRINIGTDVWGEWSITGVY